MAAVLVAACSSSSGSSDEDTTVAEDTNVEQDVAGEVAPPADVPTGDVPAEDVPPVDVPAGKVTFTGTLIGFGTNMPVPDAEVELLDNATGKGTNVKATSDADGVVEFKDIAPGKVGFLATKENHKSTYQYNLAADAVEETLWIVPNTVYTMALGLAGLTVEEGMSTVAGGIYWVDKDGVEQPVGCAEITTDPATDDIRYMDGVSGLPTTLEKQPKASPANGYFLATNLPAGQPKVVASVNGTEVGSTTIFAVADSICIANIYVSGDKNPMPSDCQ
jgi:hypothetical protein